MTWACGRAGREARRARSGKAVSSESVCRTCWACATPPGSSSCRCITSSAAPAPGTSGTCRPRSEPFLPDPAPPRPFHAQGLSLHPGASLLKGGVAGAGSSSAGSGLGSQVLCGPRRAVSVTVTCRGSLCPWKPALGDLRVSRVTCGQLVVAVESDHVTEKDSVISKGRSRVRRGQGAGRAQVVQAPRDGRQ